MKITFTLLLILLLTEFTFSQKMEIPKGAIYHHASEQVNNKSKEIISNTLNTKNSLLIFTTPVMCGPNLWNELLQKKVIDSTTGIELNFNIPVNNTLIKKSGRVIKQPEDFSPIWQYLSSLYSGKNFIVRKLNSSEIAYYWSIISYEIEEPLFIVEYNKQRLLINLNKDTLKIMFIEKFEN